MVALSAKFADRTNLLALNAAIEAARAGEADAVLPWSPRGPPSGESSVQARMRSTGSATRSIPNQQPLGPVTAVANSVDQVTEMVHATAERMPEQRARTDCMVESVNAVSRSRNRTRRRQTGWPAATQEQTRALLEISASAQALTQTAATLRQWGRAAVIGGVGTFLRYHEP